MKIFLKYFVLALLFVVLAAGSSFAGIAEYNEGEVIVVMESPEGTYGAMSATAFATALDAQALSFAQRTSLSTVHAYTTLSQSSGYSIVFFKSAEKTTAQLIEELKNEPGVLSVSPNYKGDSLASDPMISNQWGLNRINIFEAWNIYNAKSGQTVYVAVIDTGVDYNHEDLSGNIARDSSGNVIGKTFYGNGQFTDNDPMDKGKMHGTHVAGIIGAVGNNNKGIAGVHYKNIKIVPVSVFTGDGPNDGCWDGDIIRGLDYVLSLKKSGLNLRVINMSLGGWRPAPAPNGAFEIALKALSDEGVIIAIAAGNEGRNFSNPENTVESGDVRLYAFPACYWMIPNKITVGSYNPVRNDKSTFSNFDTGASSDFKPNNDSFVDMAAPGDYILSTIPGNGYDYKDGTSMATPFVAGTAALLFSLFPDKSAAEVKDCILNNTFTGTGEGMSWQHGLLNVGKAYLQFDSGATSIIPNPTIAQQPPIELRIHSANTGEFPFSVVVNRTLQLSISPYPNEFGEWSSRNNAIAEVDQTGLVTAKNMGKVEIVFTPTPVIDGVNAANETIIVDDIYHEGSMGCSAGAAPIAAVVFAGLVFMVAGRKRRH